MSRQSSISSKTPVPSPLPTRRGVAQVPPKLRADIMSALLQHKSAIQEIHSSLSAALSAEGWNERIEAYLYETITNAEGDIDEGDLLESIVGIIAAESEEQPSADNAGAAAKRNSSDRETEARLGQGLGIPGKAVDAAVGSMKKELENICVVVDAMDWQAS